MPKLSTLPPEFSAIAHIVWDVQKKSDNEWSSTCPVCKDIGHNPRSGLSDRFVMFRVGRYGFPLGFCRSCGYRWTSKKEKVSQVDIDEWRKRQIEIEKKRKYAAERALEILQNDHIWERFAEQNNEYSMSVFRSWGLSDSWIKYLKLGLIPDYTLNKDIEWFVPYHTPAFTMPIWYCGGIVQNIKLRLANPREDRDRYRNFYAMGMSFLYVPLYDLPLQGSGVVVEGEKKAAVIEQHLDDINLRVVGLQSKTPDERLISQMKDLDPIYLMLDPDAKVIEKNRIGNPHAESAEQRMVRLLGKERVRIVDLPDKPDDMVNNGADIKRYLKMAMRA